MKLFSDRTVALRCSVIAILLMVLLGVPPGSAPATDTGAVSNGDWSSAATWTNGVPGTTDNAYIGSTTPAGAAATANVTLSQNTSAGTIYLGNGAGTSGTLDLNGFGLSAGSIYLGQGGSAGAVLRSGGGTLSVANIYQNGGTFTFASVDRVQDLYVTNNSTGVTAAGGNLDNSVSIDPGSTLSLGANLTVARQIDLRGNLNANGHAITAEQVYLGFNGGPYTLSNRGPINALKTFHISSAYSPSQTTFTVTAADQISDLISHGVNTTFTAGASVFDLALFSNGASPPTYSAATTSAAGNIRLAAGVGPGCILTLGADASFGLTVNGTLNANGHTINSGVYLGNLGGPGVILNDGLVNAPIWNEAGGSQVRLRHPGDTLGSLLLSGNSSLTVADVAGQVTGLTISGQPASDLSIDPGSDLMLEVNGLARGWVFRWANPTGGDHIGDIQTLVSAGEITFSALNGGYYTLTSDASYTYVNVVPEPSTLLLSLTTAAGLLFKSRSRKVPRAK